MNVFSLVWKMVIVLSMFLTAWKLSVDYQTNTIQQSAIVAVFNPYLALMFALTHNQSLLTILEILVVFLIIIFLLLIFVLNKEKKGVRIYE